MQLSNRYSYTDISTHLQLLYSQMDAMIDQVSAALLVMQEQLTKISSDWDGGKGDKAKTNKMITGLHSQVCTKGDQLDKLARSMKQAKGVNCKIGEKASNKSRVNSDYLDDLDQCNLLGKISINV